MPSRYNSALSLAIRSTGGNLATTERAMTDQVRYAQVTLSVIVLHALWQAAP